MSGRTLTSACNHMMRRLLQEAALCRRRYPVVSDELLEVRLALFVEGAHAFLGFLALVEALHGSHAQEADAADVLAVGIERALGNGNRRRAQRFDLRSPGLAFRIELIVRHDLVGKPPFESLLCRDPTAQEPDLAGALF